MNQCLNKELLEDVFDTKFSDSQDNWKGFCPFHNEKTPSFFIHKTDLICNCFGCGISGYIDTLVAKYQGITERDALMLLDISLERRLSLTRTGRLRQPKLFPESWLAGWRTIKRHPYLLDRGFTEETIALFDIKWDRATKRVVFALREFGSNRLVGATGRSTNNGEPKWYFYWQCQKANNIFYSGAPCNTLVIVEGVFDVMWLTQHGYAAAALLGSKASSRQIDQIKRSTNEVIIALDNDQAGESGTELLVKSLKDSCIINTVKYPSFANDVCDLKKEQLEELLTNKLTPLEKKLSVNN